MIWPYIFVFLGAAFNSQMDLLLWSKPVSWYKHKTGPFWDARYAWRDLPKTLGIVNLDAWHVFKYGWMGCLCVAVVLAARIGEPSALWHLLTLPFAWFFGFEIPYNLGKYVGKKMA